MAAELTTLQVARRIADAVLLTAGFAARALPKRDVNDALDPPTQAVIRVLHETGTWLAKGSDQPWP